MSPHAAEHIPILLAQVFVISTYIYITVNPTSMLWQAVARLRADVDELQLLNRKV